jgi:hypothetical protein
MKVKIGNRIYNSNNEPIMIIFDIGEKGLIEDMHPQDMKFCAHPQGTDTKTIEHFMNGDFPKSGFIGGVCSMWEEGIKEYYKEYDE